MSPPLHVVTTGRGATRLLLVHGSAADHATWTIQLASAGLRERFTLIAYDRRTGVDTVEGHADDLAALIDGRASTQSPSTVRLTASVDRPSAAGKAGAGYPDPAHAASQEAKPQVVLPAAGPVIAVGSSFGAVVVLECARRHPELLRGAVLCEPPLPPSDDAPAMPAGFLERLDDAAARDGGEAGAELFLRTVLSDAAYDRMPRAFQARARSLWPQIRSDCGALGGYRVRYRELGAVTVPALLLGGDRSAPYFRPTLDALAAALGRARLATLAGAGHMMHADAHRGFTEQLLGFAAELPE